MSRLNSRTSVPDSAKPIPHQFTHIVKKETPTGTHITFVTDDVPPSDSPLEKTDLSLKSQLDAGIPLDRVTLHTGNRLMVADQILGYLSSRPDYVEPTPTLEPTPTTESTPTSNAE